MMIYIINAVLLYDSDTATIALIGAQENPELTLTTLSNRLLKHLLDNQGVVVSKEECLDSVWEQHGLEGSTNTLTQYISNLRKLFSAYFDEQEIIVTVPRKGYMFSPSVDVIQSEKDPVTPVIEHSSEVTSPKVFKLDLLDGLFIFAMGCLIAVCSFIYVHRVTVPEIQPVLLYNYGECPVYTFDPSENEQVRGHRSKVARQLIDEHKLTCLPYSAFYLSVNKGAEHGVSGNVMMARCTSNPSAPNSCVTYHYSRW